MIDLYVLNEYMLNEGLTELLKNTKDFKKIIKRLASDTMANSLTINFLKMMKDIALKGITNSSKSIYKLYAQFIKSTTKFYDHYGIDISKSIVSPSRLPSFLVVTVFAIIIATISILVSSYRFIASGKILSYEKQTLIQNQFSQLNSDVNLAIKKKKDLDVNEIFED